MTLVANLQLIILPQRPRSSCSTKLVCSLKNPTQQLSSSSSSPISLLPKLISFALALSLNSSSSPALAIPSLSSSQPLTTPFTQSKFVQTGLLNGKIRPCPSTNPGLCVDESDLIFLRISIDDPRYRYTGSHSGRYEGGGFSRDVMEFLVKQDVVAYRCMATKVTFVYPFTTAFGDSKGQEERMKKLIDELGWYAPTFEPMEESSFRCSLRCFLFITLQVATQDTMSLFCPFENQRKL